MSILFEAHNETGFGEWASEVDPNGELNHTTPGLAGTGGKITMTTNDGDDMELVSPTWSWTGLDLSCRFYVDFTSFTNPVASFWDVVTLRDGAVTQRLRAIIGLSGGNIQLTTRLSRDGGTSDVAAFNVGNTGVHYIEIRVKRATTNVASDGELQTYLDGVSQGTTTGIDLFDLSRPDNVAFGGVSLDVGSAGSVLLDELKVTDTATEIGAHIPLVSNTATIFRRRRRQSSLHR